MKHFATVQKEFIKRARLFEEMTAEQQKEYLREHPNSAKQLAIAGQDIASKLGNVKFDGYWPDLRMFAFTDLQYGSSFLARDFEHAEFKLQKVRQRFAEATKSQAMALATVSSEFMKRIAGLLVK